MKRVALITIGVLLIAGISGCSKTQEVTNPPASEITAVRASEVSDTETITDDQALSAIQKYCYDSNPDLEGIVNDGEYQVCWNVESSDANEIVVLFHSYTGAQIRYYIDAVSGDTYVTEFVQGITPEEEKTDESFNVRDYFE